MLWKQESFVVLRPRQIEFFRNLLEASVMVAADENLEGVGLGFQPCYFFLKLRERPEVGKIAAVDQHIASRERRPGGVMRCMRVAEHDKIHWAATTSGAGATTTR